MFQGCAKPNSFQCRCTSHNPILKSKKPWLSFPINLFTIYFSKRLQLILAIIWVKWQRLIFHSLFFFFVSYISCYFRSSHLHCKKTIVRWKKKRKINSTVWEWQRKSYFPVLFFFFPLFLKKKIVLWKWENVHLNFILPTSMSECTCCFLGLPFCSD